MTTMLRSRLRALSAIYKKRPIVANVLTYGTLYAAGDISQQTLTGKPQYDWANTGRIATVGAGIFGPLFVYWYRFLDRFLPGKSALTIAKKILMDQGIAGVAGTTIFYTSLGILERRENPFEETISKGPKTFLIGMAYWPAAQSVNFFLLPTHLRSAYVAMAAFVWLNIVCYIKSMKEEEPQA